MIHVYVTATGEFIDKLPDGNVSTFQGPEYTTKEGMPNIEREKYIYVNGELTQKPVATLSADKATIAADGADAATVSVSIEPAQDLAGLVVAAEGIEGTFDVAAGVASFPVTASVAGAIQIVVNDYRVYAPEGLRITTK